MPAKKKLKTIFKTQQEIDDFLIATVSDCSAIGSEMMAHKDVITQDIVDKALNVAFSRFKLIIGDYARHFKNGDVEDLLAELKDEEFDEFYKGCTDFTKKVLGGNNAEEGSKPEVSDKADTSDAKKD